MQEAERTCLTIAGLDPSHGAGLTRDLQTFEYFGVQGFAVCTALTIQDAEHFDHVKWIKPAYILRQLDFILRHHDIKAVKIGLIESVQLVVKICKQIKSIHPTAAIVWDPITHSSTGYAFHTKINAQYLERACRQCTVITPNRDEIKQLLPKTEDELAARALTEWCAVMLKGGHDTENPNEVGDLLFTYDGVERYMHPRVPTTMHGTGCRYSSALIALLSKGYNLNDACREAGDYVYSRLKENTASIAV